jgi:hypothetical protein
VADLGNNTIRKVTPLGTNWVVTTLAGLAGSTGSLDGTGSAARFNFGAGAGGAVAMDSAGNLYVPDYVNNTIRKGMPAGSVPPPILQPPSLNAVKGSVNEIVMFPSPGSGRRMPYENMTISLTDPFMDHARANKTGVVPQNPEELTLAHHAVLHPTDMRYGNRSECSEWWRLEHRPQTASAANRRPVVGKRSRGPWVECLAKGGYTVTWRS